MNVIAIFPITADHLAAADKLLREWDIDIAHAEKTGAHIVGRFFWGGAIAGSIGGYVNNSVFFTPPLRMRHSKSAGRDIGDHEIKFIVGALGRCAASLHASGDASFVDRVRRECARQKIDFAA